MAAVLAGWGGYYRQPVYLNEARRLGLVLRGPHINHAQRQFTVVYPNGKPTLYMGLDQVNGLTRRSKKRILNGRPFRSLEDFLTRVDPRPQEAEILIRVGALGGLGTIPGLLERIKARVWRYGQPPLLDFEEAATQESWDLPARMAAQKAILGTSVDAHPLELVSEKIGRLDAVTTLEALDKLDEQVQVVGVRQTAQRFHAPGGEAYYLLELLDLDGVLPVMMTSNFYQHHRKMLSTDQLVVVEGQMIRAKASGDVVLHAQRLWPLAAK
ncbi:MAG: hypothetical protein ISS57_01180 [Anaerolineales bacterium]|nr:hypothetical protein [Anaerolineales bacterium]